MPPSFDALKFDAPFVMQDGHSRSLHFTVGEVQSRMALQAPDALQIDYTLTMMGFLLLHPQPRHIAMIGLGGGSLVKFCHHHLAGARITVVENNPGVIALRHAFNIPDDDDRLSVLADDGAAWVQRPHAPADVLLVDGFDATGQPPALCSPAFYDACRAALAPGGVMVVNLHADHPDHAEHLQRIDRSFAGNTMQAMAAEKSNCIVFAGHPDLPVTPSTLRRLGWADTLAPQAQRQLRGEFARIGWVATGTNMPPRALP